MPCDFTYFKADESEISKLENEPKPCSLCGQVGKAFRLKFAQCAELSKDKKDEGFGCWSCFLARRFGFAKDTEFGIVDQNGVTKFYNHHLPLPENFPPSALTEILYSPKFISIQQEYWLAHCDDFMVYLGLWTQRDFIARVGAENAKALFLQMTDREFLHIRPDERGDVQLAKAWAWLDCDPKCPPLCYYSFECRHCKTLRGYWDHD